MAPPSIDYDVMPYSSMPFPETQPGSIAALATLFSRAAPAVEAARVLELGCASGGNLIPLAVRFPNATFEGVDLSARHAEDGMALIAELGLGNIVIRQGDIAALDLTGKRYDFIICHGVFSWAPKAVQEAILRICAENLTENGLAYVSYNVLPGWHLRMIARDICRYHAGDEGTPQERVARAREILSQIAQTPEGSGAYEQMLREEAKRNLRMNDSYTLGELLGADNSPCHFHEFVERAGAHGLAYLCDAGVGETVPDTLGAERDALIGAAAAGDDLAREQYSDFLTGRAFRRSILVRAETLIGRVIQPNSLARLHFSCALSQEKSSDGEYVFRRDAAKLATNDPVVGSALTYLTAAYPDTRSFDEIAAHAAEATGLERSSFSARLLDALLRTSLKGHVAISSHPLRIGSAESERPAIWSMARAQIRQNQSWVCTLLHTPIQLTPPVRFVAALLDGKNARAQIEERLAAAIAERIIVIEGVEAPSGAPAQRELAHRLLESILRDFRRSALLSPAP